MSIDLPQPQEINIADGTGTITGFQRFAGAIGPISSLVVRERHTPWLSMVDMMRHRVLGTSDSRSLLSP